MVKPTTIMIVLVIVIVSAIAYSSIPSVKDWVDEEIIEPIIPTDNDTDETEPIDPTSNYPAGWNVPGNVNHIVVSYDATRTYPWQADVTATNGAPVVLSRATSAGLVELINVYYNGGWLTAIQRDCGIAQITALGG